MTDKPARSATRWLAVATLVGLLMSALSSGCATTAGPGDPAVRGTNPVDPWERWNRNVFAFNEALDEAVLKPVATTYVEVVPRPVRTGVSNFFNNFADAWSAVNNFLQGKLGAGLQDVMRVGINTVFGVFGLIDMAADAGIDHQYEDFGQTLGRWGVGAGPYIVWPLLGPSTLRDSVALPLDRSATPAAAFGDDASRYAITGLSIVDTRAGLLGATKLLDEIALDKYLFVRDGFLQRRRSLVRDGAEEPEESAADPAPESPGAAGPGAGK